MHTNIPINETVEITINLLFKTKKLSYENINELKLLLNTILNQNYFHFIDKFYIQNKGLGMGNPLSGSLADIFINHLENKICI